MTQNKLYSNRYNNTLGTSISCSPIIKNEYFYLCQVTLYGCLCIKPRPKMGLHLPLEKEIINDFWKFLPFSFIKQMNPADCSLTRDRYYFYRWWVLGNEYRTKCFTENKNSNGSWILCPITLVIGSFQVLNFDTQLKFKNSIRVMYGEILT